jgi:hypothetical protein
MVDSSVKLRIIRRDRGANAAMRALELEFERLRYLTDKIALAAVGAGPHLVAVRQINANARAAPHLGRAVTVVEPTMLLKGLLSALGSVNGDLGRIEKRVSVGSAGAKRARLPPYKRVALPSTGRTRRPSSKNK